eukprot:TRINITY_DN1556_c0_g1_i2.p3 TRINITY_DN1556_c0_g1~~TRINITY_DN1556_c0_g1_i2.p3  ORF type:complete len:365 (-),score=16.72 TRINITY_DN1556_c0_g1_i2:1369-2463(-)
MFQDNCFNIVHFIQFNLFYLVCKTGSYKQLTQNSSRNQLSMQSDDVLKVPPRKVQKISKEQQPGLVDRFERLSVRDYGWKKGLYQQPAQVKRSTLLTQPIEFQLQTEIRGSRHRVAQTEKYVGLQEFCNQFWTKQSVYFCSQSGSQQLSNKSSPPVLRTSNRQRQPIKSSQELELERIASKKPFEARQVDKRIFDQKLWGMMGVPFKAVAQTTVPQPFSLSTHNRCTHNQELSKDNYKQSQQNQANKKGTKERKIQPYSKFVLHSQRRAEERVKLRKLLNQKRNEDDMRQKMLEMEAELRDQNLLREYRQSIEFKANPMPDLSVPDFIPEYTQQTSTIPSQFGRRKHKRRNDSFDDFQVGRFFQ